jgi:N-acyl-D-amino-acid deacylase
VADLVLFDPDTVIDRATPENPHRVSDGITAVWVGGELVFEDGATTDARPGKVIRRSKK